MSRPGLCQLTAIFLRIGNTTFGGGDPMIAAMQRELLHRKHWISEQQFGLSYTLARLTPGTNVLAFSAAAGWFVRGILGAMAAVFSISLPSALLAVWVLIAYQNAQSNPWVNAAAGAILAAVAGMMAASAWLLVQPRIRSGGLARCLLLTGGAAALHFQFHVSPLLILLIAAITGSVWKEPACQ